MLTNWDSRFIALAYQVATWSKDQAKQVGAVLVSPDKRQFSFGYNGLPKDFELGDAVLKGIIDNTERAGKNSITLHAELNAIFNSVHDIAGWTMYITEPPCLHCACSIRQKQLKEVIIPKISPESSWYIEQTRAIRLLQPVVIVRSFNKEEYNGNTNRRP
jgi:dCMP deaminase